MGRAADDVTRLAHSVLKPGFAGTTMPGWLGDAIDGGLRSVCYFGHNIDSVEQTAVLSRQLHERGMQLIATDEEGGIVSRLGARTGSRHVGAAALGQADDLDLTRGVASRIGADLASVGIDVDLAPVADINSNPANPVIGVRSFGADPEHVARHVVAYAEGLRSQGVLACAKHFPGHGDTAVDSHVGMPQVDADAITLRRRELVPFARLAKEQVPMIMTGHILVPAIDPKRPATLSAAEVDLLRGELGFEGVVASDALDMGAITGTVGLARGCVDALLAGCDLLGLGNPVLGRPDGLDRRIFDEAVSAIVEAVHSGDLPMARLVEASERVAGLVALRSSDAPREDVDPGVDLRAAAASLQTRGVRKGVLSGRSPRILDIRRQRNVASGRLTSAVTDRLLQDGATLTHAFERAATVEGHAGEVSSPVAQPLTEAPDVIVTGTPGIDAAEGEQLRQALAANPDAVVICMGYVADDRAVPEARSILFTLGDSLPTADAVADFLL